MVLLVNMLHGHFVDDLEMDGNIVGPPQNGRCSNLLITSTLINT